MVIESSTLVQTKFMRLYLNLRPHGLGSVGHDDADLAFPSLKVNGESLKNKT